MKDDIYKIMLAHMRYSFSEIDWKFDNLTAREKSLLKSQENLDKIRRVATLSLVEADDAKWQS